MVHEVEECTLPKIPVGMHPDETWGEQCYECPWGMVAPNGEAACVLDAGDAGTGSGKEEK